MLTYLRSACPVRLTSGDTSSQTASVSGPERSLDLTLSTSTLVDPGSKPSVLEIIKQNVPSLNKKTCSFKPSLAFALGDVQTVFSNFATVHAPLTYERYFVTADDGGTLALDFASAPWLADDAPIVIVVPGLAGSSQSTYVNSAVEELIKLREGPVNAYRVVAMNTRGSSDNPLTSAYLTHAGSTTDLRTTVSYVLKNYPEAKSLFALGYSMGGGLLSNYLAEEGDTCSLSAGFCISTVWDLEACNKRIEDGHYHRMLYSYLCGSTLTRIVREHKDLFTKAGATGLDELLSHSLVRMSTFNDIFMSHLAGYANTAEFADATSPIFRVGKVRRPCVFLNAQDDPLYGGKCLEAMEKVVRESGQEGLVLAVTKRGGHVGYLQRNEEGNLEQWFIHPVREFFDAILMETKKELI